MKLKIISGELICEIVEDDAFGLTEAKNRLKLIINGLDKDVSKPTKDGMGKLKKQPKIPI